MWMIETKFDSIAVLEVVYKIHQRARLHDKI